MSLIDQVRSSVLLNKIVRFLGIGIINAMIHTILVVFSVEKLGLHPGLSNAIAFSIANIFSYFANRRWNFRGTASLQQYGRFLSVSLLGLTTTILISSVVEWIGWHYLIGLVLVFVALPVFTFLLHWKWTFKQQTS